MLSFALLSPVATLLTHTVCVYNDAAFVLTWRLKNVDTGAESAEVTHYPVGQVRCLSAKMSGVAAGTALVPVVHAVWGKTITASEPVVFEPSNVSSITYVCKGTTLDFACKPETPPPTAGEVVKDMGAFLTGFAEAIAPGLGFQLCLEDANKTYTDVVQAVEWFESGINLKRPTNIVKAFELVGHILSAAAAAIAECVKDAVALVSKIKGAAAALSGNVLAILKIVVDEAIHIWQDRKELTDDCQTTAADWKAGDFEGSGRAVGDITSVIIAGLAAKPVEYESAWLA